MKIASYQMDIVPGNPSENRKKIKMWAEQICKEQQPDILVLPEMWTTAYTLPTLEVTIKPDKDVTELFLEDLASKLNVNIVAGSIAVEEDDGIYNRSYILNRNGQIIYTYDKIHLVPMLDEHLYLIGGRSSVQVFELEGRKMGIIICYDLRFPELVRSLALQGAEVVFVVAEWPMARANHWEVLQQARAIENQLFVVSCNRVGTYDEVEFAGNSMVINPWGDIVHKASSTREETISVSLKLDEVSRIRKDVPVFSSRVPKLYVEDNAN
ncbi:carbon-nitrogen family hydrolase [Halalkalibacter alkaliphilus]|uniref:Carbon-nitrogen family hydrolase n=1 Tax=Halalkalibacter alkaliphilus TaxID=2917993 RepID=A0A9X2I7J2_9BACI|nr:carbon-nitrogen family hydrolase [Halalkalibacter alkaliphilus]MCL7747745.1 carbon-nitrogen family hydrolase [Halalkalibacter alkaliphilus]